MWYKDVRELSTNYVWLNQLKPSTTKSQTTEDYEVAVWPKHAIATEYKPVILRCTVVYYKEMYTEPLIWLQNSREYFSVGEAGHNFITKGICGHWGWSQPGMTRALVIRTRLAASIIRFLFQWI